MGARLGRIQAALRSGAVMFGTIVVNGAVLITVQRGGHLRGFGEAAGIENAFHKVNESLSIDVKLEEAALAAETIFCERRIDISTKLDERMRHRSMPVFISGWSDDNFSFRLSGTHIVAVPPDVMEQVMNTGKGVTWESKRGYTYLTSPDLKISVAGSIATIVLSSPKGEGDDGFGLSYPTIKLGFGTSLWAAIEDALGSPESEEVDLIP